MTGAQAEATAMGLLLPMVATAPPDLESASAEPCSSEKRQFGLPMTRQPLELALFPDPATMKRRFWPTARRRQPKSLQNSANSAYR